jgi:hypothetical protein
MARQTKAQKIAKLVDSLLQWLIKYIGITLISGLRIKTIRDKTDRMNGWLKK